MAERVGGDRHRERHTARRRGVHPLIDPCSYGPVGDLPEACFFCPAGPFVTPLQGDLQRGHHGLQLADIPGVRERNPPVRLLTGGQPPCRPGRFFCPLPERRQLHKRIRRGEGKTAPKWSWPRWRGWTGKTVAGCWKGLDISLRQKPDRHIMLPSGIRSWQPEFPTKILSRKTGAVHILIMPVSHPAGKPGVFPIYWPAHFLRIIVSASQPHQIPASQTAPGAVQPHPVQTPSCRPPLS